MSLEMCVRRVRLRLIKATDEMEGYYERSRLLNDMGIADRGR